ncbi:MAG: hypothetical protein GY719_07270 [bacterium]|nr:hypothetical protein [bacterium]
MSHVTSPESDVVDLEIRVDRDKVLRWLGYRGSRGPRPREGRRIEELWPVAHDLVEPRGAFRIVSGKRTGEAGMPRPTSEVGVGIATIGPALEDEARRRGERGDLLDALVLDAFGSAAAEAAADRLNQKLCVRARDEDRYPAARISPGYGAWRVDGQGTLLALLPAARLGVRLTGAMMLVPHKSVSFAVRFGCRPSRPDLSRWRCKRCGLIDCRYRERRPA